MPLTIYFGPSLGRDLTVEHHFAVVQLLRLPGLTYRPVTGDALIERSRSIAMTQFLEQSACDVLLTIDGDIAFRLPDAVRICQQAVERRAIVGGVYVTRNREHCWPTSDWEGTIDFAGEIGVDDEPVPVNYVATGFMAVPRCVPEALIKRPDLPRCHEDREWAFYPFYSCFPVQNAAGKWIFLSEDYALSHRAKEAGFGCLVNPAVRIAHYGHWPYRLEDMVERPGPTREVRVSSAVDPHTGEPLWHAEAPNVATGLDHAAALIGADGQPRHRKRQDGQGQPILIVPAGRGPVRTN